LPLGVPRRPIGSTSLWMVGLGIGALIYAALKLWH
jgi:hypothetical protein